jgi:predicted enzyme related to lactoylglutathione lyase
MEPAEPGRVVHLELHTSDLADARAFYGELCGWRQEQVQIGTGTYWAVALGGSASGGGAELGGGMVECPVARPLWLPYVEVTDVAVMTDRARALGARVLLEPREGPVGWRSVVGTPAAGEIALWQPKR